MIEGIDITVDGEKSAAQLDRRMLAQCELDAQTMLRWPVGGTIDVLIDKRGGLAAGVYLVESAIYFRHPYFPPEFRPVCMRDRRHVAIVL